jgi:hypothetical protein
VLAAPDADKHRRLAPRMANSCIWPEHRRESCPKCSLSRDQQFAQAFLAYAELRTGRLSWSECPARMTAGQGERGKIEINAV